MYRFENGGTLRPVKIVALSHLALIAVRTLLVPCRKLVFNSGRSSLRHYYESSNTHSESDTLERTQHMTEQTDIFLDKEGNSWSRVGWGYYYQTLQKKMHDLCAG